MAYIIGFILIAIFFLALHYFTELNILDKFSVIATVLSIIAIAIMFNEYNDKKNTNMMNVVKKFNQNKTVKCEGIDVNNSNYTLSVGTYTFIGKQNSSVRDEMISASDCE